jgi:hypothetical protein
MLGARHNLCLQQHMSWHETEMWRPPSTKKTTECFYVYQIRSSFLVAHKRMSCSPPGYLVTWRSRQICTSSTSDEALLSLFYLAHRNISKYGKQPIPTGKLHWTALPSSLRGDSISDNSDCGCTKRCAPSSPDSWHWCCVKASCAGRSQLDRILVASVSVSECVRLGHIAYPGYSGSSCVRRLRGAGSDLDGIDPQNSPSLDGAHQSAVRRAPGGGFFY